jgi:hypothetical protein
MVAGVVDGLRQINCLSLPDRLHRSFAIDFAEKLFSTVLLAKVHSLVSFPEELEADAATVQTPEDLLAYISGAVLSSLHHGALRNPTAPAWEDVGSIIDVLVAKKPEESGLPPQQLAWIQLKSSGALLTPVAKVMPLFVEIDRVLSALHSSVITQDSTWTQIQIQVEKFIAAILRETHMSFFCVKDYDEMDQKAFAFARQFTRV